MPHASRRSVLTLLGGLLAGGPARADDGPPEAVPPHGPTPGAAARALTIALPGRVSALHGPFLLGQVNGRFLGEGIEAVFQPGATSREVLERVTRGEVDLGVSDVNLLVRARDEGALARGVFMLDDRPLHAVVGRRSRGITEELASLRDKRLGAPAGDPAAALWPVLRAVNGLAELPVRLDPVGPNVLQPMLAAGEVDAAFGNGAALAADLKARGVPPDDLVVLWMADYGLAIYGRSLVASPALMAERPEVLRAALRAVTLGLRDTLAEPGAAVEAVLRRASGARREAEAEKLRVTIERAWLTPWTRAEGLGEVDDERFARAGAQLARGYPLKAIPKPDEVCPDTYLPDKELRRVV